MINKYNFNRNLNEVEYLLKKIKFLRQRGIKILHTDGVSDAFKKASQKINYFNTYNIGLQNLDYDFLFFDQSYLQFSFEVNLNKKLPKLRYAFYQNPQEFKTYFDYLEYLKTEQIIDNNDTYNNIGDIFQEEYEQFLTESQLNTSSIPIRYDLDIDNYKELLHSASHLHIGYANDIRIPVNKIVTPVQFTLFVIKHLYYHKWKTLLENEEFVKKNILFFKKNNNILENEYWKDIEKNELYLI